MDERNYKLKHGWLKYVVVLQRRPKLMCLCPPS